VDTQNGGVEVQALEGLYTSGRDSKEFDEQHNPDPHPGPHYSEKLDPDPHLS
jgi:hypothetical protein